MSLSVSIFPRIPVCLLAPLPARPPSVPKPPSLRARPPHIRAISGLGLKAQQLRRDASAGPRLRPRATGDPPWELRIFSAESISGLGLDPTGGMGDVLELPGHRCYRESGRASAVALATGGNVTDRQGVCRLLTSRPRGGN